MPPDFKSTVLPTTEHTHFVARTMMKAEPSPMIILYDGRPIEELTREELIDALHVVVCERELLMHSWISGRERQTFLRKKYTELIKKV